MLLQAIVVAALAVGSTAFPSKYVVHEKRSVLDGAPSRGARVQRDAVIPVRIGLKQRNLDQGYDYLMDISHPSSPNYGKHWTLDQVRETFAPTAETADSVRAWLFEAGISADKISYSPKGWFSFDLPAHQAEELLQTEYYEHPAGETVRIGCDEYKLPEHISQHIDYVKPGVALSPPMKLRKRNSANPARPNLQGPKQVTPPARPAIPDAGSEDLPGDVQNCGQGITPPCIQYLYQIPAATYSDSSNLLGIYEAGQAYSQDDLNLYYSNYATYVPQGTGPSVVSVNGGEAPASDSSDISFEADIDFQMAYSLLYPQGAINYQDGTASANEDDQDFVTGILDSIDGSYCTQAEINAGFDCGTYNLTNILSVSYTETELGLSLAGQNRSCNEIMQQSLLGHTFLFASGDYGVSSSPATSSGLNGCFDPDNIYSGNGSVFNPTFPNNCPYVLSVGGTQLASGGTVADPESVMEIPSSGDPSIGVVFGSAGGFANYFPTPSYQQSAVDAYFQNYDPGYPYYTFNGVDVIDDGSNVGENGGLYNRAGRGFPDVSANGAIFLAAYDGSTTGAIGTSLAAPLWASILTMINMNRTEQGKGPVGFVNPVLYENPSAFQDITNGSNPGCNTNGFAAVPGWDPTTGLGTPNFPALLDIFASLP